MWVISTVALPCRPDLEPQATQQEQPAEDQPPEEEEEGAVGGFDPAEGIEGTQPYSDKCSVFASICLHFCRPVCL